MSVWAWPFPEFLTQPQGARDLSYIPRKSILKKPHSPAAIYWVYSYTHESQVPLSA